MSNRSVESRGTYTLPWYRISPFSSDHSSPRKFLEVAKFLESFHNLLVPVCTVLYPFQRHVPFFRNHLSSSCGSMKGCIDMEQLGAKENLVLVILFTPFMIYLLTTHTTWVTRSSMVTPTWDTPLRINRENEHQGDRREDTYTENVLSHKVRWTRI